MSGSFVVTRGGRGVGRAIVERLGGDGFSVAVIELDGSALEWLDSHAARDRLAGVVGNASDAAVADEAADRAEALGTLRGWVNNAAIFRDAQLDTPEEVLDIINLNLAPVVIGCATAVRRFRAAGTGGSIVNVSSHQAQRAVRGALPYATAKAAIEGLTRAAAVDHGSDGVRVNAVALGRSIPSSTSLCCATSVPRVPLAPKSRWRSCTRLVDPDAPTRSPTPWPTCCPVPPAS